MKYLFSITLLILIGASQNLGAAHPPDPIVSAIWMQDIDLVQEYINLNKDLITKHGSTLLYLAVITGNVKITKLFLDAGVDPNMKDKNGDTPLHLAAKEWYIDMVDLLVKSKANVNIKNNDGWTPLHTSIAHSQTGTSKFLLRNGANVNAKTIKDNWTPLHLAVKFNNLELVKLFLRAGASPNIKDASGKTPLDYADPKDKKMKNVFRKARSTTNNKLHPNYVGEDCKLAFNI